MGPSVIGADTFLHYFCLRYVTPPYIYNRVWTTRSKQLTIPKIPSNSSLFFLLTCVVYANLTFGPWIWPKLILKRDIGHSHLSHPTEFYKNKHSDWPDSYYMYEDLSVDKRGYTDFPKYYQCLITMTIYKIFELVSTEKDGSVNFP